ALALTVVAPPTVDPAVGAVMLTVGAVVSLSTVIVTGAEVVRLPAPSRATAVRLCDPLLAPVVSHEIEYGAVVSSAPRLAPSSLNWTPTTPTLSEALALTVVVPLTVDPAVGAVRPAVGTVGPLITAAVTGLPLVRLSAPS